MSEFVNSKSLKSLSTIDIRMNKRNCIILIYICIFIPVFFALIPVESELIETKSLLKLEPEGQNGSIISQTILFTKGTTIKISYNANNILYFSVKSSRILEPIIENSDDSMTISQFVQNDAYYSITFQNNLNYAILINYEISRIIPILYLDLQIYFIMIGMCALVLFVLNTQLPDRSKTSNVNMENNTIINQKIESNTTKFVNVDKNITSNSKTCPHCGYYMPLDAQICDVCKKSRNS